MQIYKKVTAKYDPKMQNFGEKRVEQQINRFLNFF
jgi:hypothetical protein